MSHLCFSPTLPVSPPLIATSVTLHRPKTLCQASSPHMNRHPLSVNPSFRIPNLRGPPLHLSLLAASSALITVDILHTTANTVQEQLNLVVPDALATTAATAAFCTAFSNKFSTSSMSGGEREHQDSPAPTALRCSDAEAVYSGSSSKAPSSSAVKRMENVRKRVQKRTGATAIAVCREGVVVRGVGRVSVGGRAGQIVARVRKLGRGAYLRNSSSLPEGVVLPFEQGVWAAYMLPVKDLVVAFGVEGEFEKDQREWMREVIDEVVKEMGGE